MKRAASPVLSSVPASGGPRAARRAALSPVPPAPALGPAASPDAAPECRIGYAVKRLQHRMRQVLERTLAARGVDMGFAALLALSTLRARPGRSGAQLARDCFVSPQTMSNLLRHMEADRWVTRGPHPENARIDLWSLSRRGIEMLERADDALGPLDRHMRGALTLRERQQFERCLGKLAASLDDWDGGLGLHRSQDDDDA